jgi:hypothetical protein
VVRDTVAEQFQLAKPCPPSDDHMG